ncbi:hypothetical protein SELMODRAFT_441604 [Selaginella moellendorffii]|uniref:Uncharacterized protein n=1 Tax=Selaginella moellendorffii TaxID=88036 RepID=D8RKZ3_SELML|nr:hypothetical protein SELMODRAFT_441604 [Selaginella moellendorffii]
MSITLGFKSLLKSSFHYLDALSISKASGNKQLVAAIANKLGYDVYNLNTGLVAQGTTDGNLGGCVHGIGEDGGCFGHERWTVGSGREDLRIHADESKPDTVFPGCQPDRFLRGHGFQMLKRTLKLHLGVEDHRLLGEIKGLMMDREKESNVGELLALVLGTNSGSNSDVVLEKVAAHLKSKKTSLAFPPLLFTPNTSGAPAAQASTPFMRTIFGRGGARPFLAERRRRFWAEEQALPLRRRRLAHPLGRRRREVELQQARPRWRPFLAFQ